jgi:guanylate kinase
MNQSKRIIIFSGPSCVGKSPLAKALAKFYPGLHSRLKPLVLYNSRQPRPGEADGIDYHFRKRDEIEKLRIDNRFIVMDVRGDLQAVDMAQLSKSLMTNDVFFEGNPFVGKLLLTNALPEKIQRLGIFMSPVSRDEILYLKNIQPSVYLPDIITDIMRRKLIRRTRLQKGELSFSDLENIEKRAKSAFTELLDAHNFQFVIPSHDGEDSDNWSAFYYPLGDARKALLTFAALLEGKKGIIEETWEQGLLP